MIDSPCTRHRGYCPRALDSVAAAFWAIPTSRRKNGKLRSRFTLQEERSTAANDASIRKSYAVSITLPRNTKRIRRVMKWRRAYSPRLGRLSYDLCVSLRVRGPRGMCKHACFRRSRPRLHARFLFERPEKMLLLWSSRAVPLPLSHVKCRPSLMVTTTVKL